MTIFEKIIAREIPADIVYEDELVLAFLDIRPNSKGHTLIIPKEMFVNIFDANEEVAGHMMKVAKKIALGLKKTVGATGVNLVMNNGDDAGQEVCHAHLHVIPRHKDDNVYQPPQHTSYDDGEAAVLAENIKNSIL